MAEQGGPNRLLGQTQISRKMREIENLHAFGEFAEHTERCDRAFVVEVNQRVIEYEWDRGAARNGVL